MDTVMVDSSAWEMNSQLMVPIIVAFGMVAVAVISSLLTYWLTRRMQLEAEWRKDKLKHYSQLLDGITETMSMPTDFDGAHKQFVFAYNKVALVAPQGVANVLFDFYYAQQRVFDKEEPDEYGAKHVSEQKRRLKDLVLGMRKDLRLKPKDDPNTFNYKLRSPLCDQE
jgi:hypothetical protein